MTRALPFTQAHVRRAVEAARAAGLPVSGVSIKPDGTICVHSGDNPTEGLAPGKSALDASRVASERIAAMRKKARS